VRAVTDFDDFQDDKTHWRVAFALNHWRRADALTIREAACLLADIDPNRFAAAHKALPTDVDALATALTRSVLASKLPAFAIWTWNDDGELTPIEVDDVSKHTRISDDTILLVEDLVNWCNGRNIEHIWDVPESALGPSIRDLSNYPDELRAAIEAFEEVSRDVAATSRRTPKAALAFWLEKHRPGLSVNARDRIATVANWLPAGGAPKTPGSKPTPVR
jgi:hypothetical protein